MLEQQRPDFEFDEFFYDDEEEPEDLPKSHETEPQRPVEPSYEAEKPPEGNKPQKRPPIPNRPSKSKNKKESAQEKAVEVMPEKKSIRQQQDGQHHGCLSG